MRMAFKRFAVKRIREDSYEIYQLKRMKVGPKSRRIKLGSVTRRGDRWEARRDAVVDGSVPVPASITKMFGTREKAMVWVKAWAL